MHVWQEVYKRLNIKQMLLANCYTLYSDIIDTISIFNASKLIGIQKELTGGQARTHTAQIWNIESQIAGLRAPDEKGNAV